MSLDVMDNSEVGFDQTFQCSDPEEDLKTVCPKSSLTSFRIILVKDAAQDSELVEACQTFKVPVSVSDKIQTENSNSTLSVYVVNSLDDVEENELDHRSSNYRIVGRPALLEIVKRQEESRNYTIQFSLLEKPVFCYALSEKMICFTGFEKSDKRKVKSLVYHMGGEVDENSEINSETKYLVAKIRRKVYEGQKYRYATTFNVPVVSETWLYDAWKNRNTVGFNAADEDFVKEHKFKLFHKCRICFLGFTEEEQNDMINSLKDGGGEPVDLTDASCSHVVVDDSKITVAPPLKSNRTVVLKAEWFWKSIQLERHESVQEYKLDRANNNNTLNITPLGQNTTSMFSTPTSGTRKRKILKDKFSCSGDSSPRSAQKRRSSVSDLTRLSEGSFLDYTYGSTITTEGNESITSEKLKNSKRYHKFLELWHTETNYVGILKTIMTLFKDDLEDLVDRKGQELLNATELKIIFGHLPPIYKTHEQMLKDLGQLASNWNEECSIGSLILKYSGDLVKAYPPFINFFENTRDMLIKCDKSNPRFHAFLKLRQSKPECGRQSLQDLLIRPVQRLPSINLLLNDILRGTSKNSVDYEKLEVAIKEIQKVMTYINEDKKRTEGQVALFDIFNEIENCPADLVSSHRCFINRCEVTSRSGDLSGKGKPLVLFLFSDVIEVCKKKTKASSKENNVTVGSKHGCMKLYKHVAVIRLTKILKVIDIKETEECHNNFALVVKKDQHMKESEELFSFTITDNNVDKPKYLWSLCNEIANTVCTTNTESYLTQLEAQQLDIDSNEANSGPFSKALNIASETRKKVQRAFSFNKTPNKLKRAMSTMMSPFGSQNGLTPSSQLANLQLAALPPIPNYGDDSILDTPTSSSRVRKNKSSSFSMGSLRRV